MHYDSYYDYIMEPSAYGSDLVIMEEIPPDTGASMKTAPIFSAAAAISFETAGSIVLESMRSEPFFTFLWREVHNLEAD